MRDVIPDEYELEQFEAAMAMAYELASLSLLADAGASRRELRQAITAAIDSLPETARQLVDVALTVADPPDLAVTSRPPGRSRDRGHLRLVPPSGSR